MTLYVPLSSGTGTTSPGALSTLKQSSNNPKDIQRAARAIAKAKRIVVVCGAGVSVQAGIPDFRSPDGLFQQLKREHPKEGLSNGKELFDASVFHSESTATIFYKMIARLSGLVERAQPTPFHHLLKTLDERKQLLRCYTQNIDSMEEKAGLSFGVPSRQLPRKSPKKPKSSPSSTPAVRSVSPSPTPPPAPIPSPPAVEDIPRCIPLHGTLKTLHCRTCGATTSLAENVSMFENGSAPACAQCSEFEHTRQLVGKRLRGVGVMRPSIVLYNEDHREGERVGDIVEKDLTGGRTKRAPPDLLLVVGTSLRVPGTKRIVKEFSKAARVGITPPDSRSSTPSSSQNRTSPSSNDSDDRPIRTIYLNFDFPSPAREWESIFDVWVQGDIQEFVTKIQEAMAEQDGVKKAKEEKMNWRTAASGEKRKREPERQVEEEGGSGSLNRALAASSISGKRRRTSTVIERDHANTIITTTAPQFRVAVAPPKGPGGVDVFGPVLPTRTLPFPMMGSSRGMPNSTRTMPDVHASLLCGIERRMGYHTFPLTTPKLEPTKASALGDA